MCSGGMRSSESERTEARTSRHSAGSRRQRKRVEAVVSSVPSVCRLSGALADFRDGPRRSGSRLHGGREPDGRVQCLGIWLDFYSPVSSSRRPASTDPPPVHRAGRTHPQIAVCRYSIRDDGLIWSRFGRRGDCCPVRVRMRDCPMTDNHGSADRRQPLVVRTAATMLQGLRVSARARYIHTYMLE